MACRDLIIGGAYGYNWDDLKFWVNSIKRTDFDGDIVLLGKMDFAVRAKLKREGVIVPDAWSPVGAPHVERFGLIHNYLVEHSNEYRFVTVTDTRDVIFQKSPSNTLENLLSYSDRTMVCSSEGLLYKDEPWGNKNIQDALGGQYERLANRLIYNVGTIGGEISSVSDFILILYELSRGKGIVDQAMFNLMISCDPYREKFYHTDNEHNWAIQLGTTEAAVKSGSGDIGIAHKYANYPIEEYHKVYKDVQPIIEGNRVLTPNLLKEEYVIVHQYDRVDGLKDAIRKKYG